MISVGSAPVLPNGGIFAVRVAGLGRRSHAAWPYDPRQPLGQKDSLGSFQVEAQHFC